MRPFLDSTDAVGDGAELLTRMERDGCLFIRDLMPADVLEDLRIQFLEIASAAGWVKQSVPLESAIADLRGFCVEPTPEYMDVYARMYALPDFHAIQHHPILIDLFERMTGEEIMPHPRIIGRTIFPQMEAYTTPPHQDFIPIQGTPDTYTAWIPLSDLPAEMGGLQIASGSHRHGVYDFKPALGAGAMEVTDPLDGTWVNGPFTQGDVLIFHSMAVHKGVPNSSEQLRVSIDARYQRVSEPIAPGSFLPHGRSETSWESIYAEWPSEELQYYWKKWDLEVAEYDNSYHEKRDELAFELAEQGDETARSALQRVVSRDEDAAKRKRAEELLAQLDLLSEGQKSSG